MKIVRLRMVCLVDVIWRRASDLVSFVCIKLGGENGRHSSTRGGGME